MSEKETKNTIEVESTKAPEPFKYGVSPFLAIAMVRESRVYRFEMPIGAHLDECKEACKECLVVIKKMREEAEAKAKEAEAVKDEPSVAEVE